MILMGIVADKKMQKLLEKHNKEVTMIPLRKENSKNLKHVTLDTVILDQEIQDIDSLLPFLQKATYIICNKDRKHTFLPMELPQTTWITYGFNSQCTLTASSIMEEKILLCLQQNVRNKSGKIIEPQEFWVKVKQRGDVYAIMAETCMHMIYEP